MCIYFAKKAADVVENISEYIQYLLQSNANVGAHPFVENVLEVSFFLGNCT